MGGLVLICDLAPIYIFVHDQILVCDFVHVLVHTMAFLCTLIFVVHILVYDFAPICNFLGQLCSSL